jgi:hypothetical protein
VGEGFVAGLPRPGGNITGFVHTEGEFAGKLLELLTKIAPTDVAEEYKFRVEREKRESERKKIEAEGIRDFQQTVSQGISESYLRWRGIEATLQLSQSTNAKTVIIGNAKDGLPIILGNGGAPAQPAGSTTPDGNDNKERTTAASPAVPLERTPAAALATPAEKIPPASSSTPSGTNPETRWL